MPIWNDVVSESDPESSSAFEGAVEVVAHDLIGPSDELAADEDGGVAAPPHECLFDFAALLGCDMSSSSYTVGFTPKSQKSDRIMWLMQQLLLLNITTGFSITILVIAPSAIPRDAWRLWLFNLRRGRAYVGTTLDDYYIWAKVFGWLSLILINFLGWEWMMWMGTICMRNKNGTTIRNLCIQPRCVLYLVQLPPHVCCSPS